jgi:AcrR family transcriptional regulator
MMKQDEMETMTAQNCAAAGRFAAGADPVKRGQILDGAKRVFMKLGYDAASMNDVTREAGVSKGTIYVYFQSKEDLFGALVEREKSEFDAAVEQVLAESKTVEEGLRRYALAHAHFILDTDMIPTMRILMGVLDRMPARCQRFFASSPTNIKLLLQGYIEAANERGELSVDDTDLAARQFIDMSTAGYFKKKLFNDIPARPDNKEIERVVESGLRMFMNFYGPKKDEAQA